MSSLRTRVMRRLPVPLSPGAWLLAGGILGAVVLSPLLAQAQTGEHNRLEQLAREFVTPAMAGAPATGGPVLRPEVVFGSLDSRLRLAPCEQVEPHLPQGTRLWGRSRIGLRCVKGPVRWNVYLPVTVKAFGPAWVLRRPVAAGATLTEEDAEQVETDWAQHPATVLADPALWVGRQASFNLQPGQALRQHMVRAAPAFAAGAMVKVSSGGPGFQVVVTGEAMAPGLPGQATRVRLPGGRVVSGLVRDDQTVELGL